MENKKSEVVKDEFGNEYVEVPETYTTVDLSISSGFKFGIGFAFGFIVVGFLSLIFFGTLLAGFLRELSRSFT